MKALFALFPLAAALATAPSAWTADVRVYPAPEGESLSKDFRVTVEDQPVPVYLAKVAPADPARRWKAMDDKANSADYFELASCVIPARGRFRSGSRTGSRFGT